MKPRRWMAALLLLALALPLLFAGAAPALAQDAAPLVIDADGQAQVVAQELAPGAELLYSLSLAAGDRVLMELLPDKDQGADQGAVAIAQFAASYGALELETISPTTTLGWAPEDGEYTITVKNSGETPTSFNLSVGVTAAPLPAKKIISADADGQTVPVAVGEAVQVSLDALAGDGYAWSLQEYDGAVLGQEGEAVAIVLGTQPGAMSRQIFTFVAAAPGAAALTFDYAKQGGEAEKSFAVTVEVLATEDAATEDAATEEPVAAEESAPIVPDPIALDQGAVLVIPLAGNPSTGYLWQVKPSAEGILSARGDAAYASSADMPGAPGYEIFTFDAAGPGDVTLTFTYSRLWDETTPPDQVIDLPFVVTAPPAPVETPAPPAPIEIGEAENGGTVEMQVGGALFVNLPGNPTTGYIWQITSKDDAYLMPLDYTFQPQADAPGSGGVERFEFEAVAGGEVTLSFAQGRPWETDAEPAATYTVTVTITAAAE